ncbi:MAG: carboxypeptidase regulatory-like domain-containing protein [Deltaproteobacteria bacterium]|nr:carboxypeptidase regulatory-like domain-containing protein [Deltaproteobacteria bacterium]
MVTARTRYWGIALMFSWAWLAIWCRADAGPVVLVKGRPRLVIEEVRPTGRGATVVGRLVEAHSGEGIPGTSVEVAVGWARKDAVTGEGGAFAAEFPLATGLYEVTARFLGSDVLDPATAEKTRVDIGKAAMALLLQMPSSVPANIPEIEVALEARVDDQRVSVPVQLEISDPRGDGRKASAVRTDDKAPTQVRIPRSMLGAPGEKRLIARFLGNVQWNEALTETTFLLETATSIEDLALPTTFMAHESALVAKGRLVDADGQPLPRMPVSMIAQGRRVAESTTEPDGQFRLKVAAAELGPGDISVIVEHPSPLPWRRGTRTTSKVVRIMPPRPIPIAHTLMAFGAAAAGLLSLVAWRTQPWKPLLERLAQLRHAPPPRKGSQAPEKPASSHPGARFAKPSLLMTLKRAADHVVSGWARDAATLEPLMACGLTLISPSAAPVVVVTGETGEFETPPLTAGPWRVEACCHGFVTERFEVSIPHRGELRGMRIDLIPVRERAFAMYRGVAARLLPSPDLWGVWTPREICRHARGQLPGGPLRDLTDLVEETYYSSRIPDESILLTVKAQVDAVRLESSRSPRT